MEHLYGRGFLTSDRDMWNYSRKLLKPTFARDNIMDLSAVGNELDKLIGLIPDNGTAIDL
jgi:hypothetical protein